MDISNIMDEIQKNYWQNKRVLITGATGFLGGWITKKLISYGSEIHVIQRSKRPESQFILDNLGAKCHIYNGQVYDEKIISDIFDNHKIDAVFHTAANADVNNALQNPIDNFKSSIDSTIFLLENIRTKNPNCAIIISSSDKAYGPQKTPFKETSALRPHHPYEVAKASQDHIAQSYGKVFNIPVAVTRCGNYFGGWDFNWTRIIPGTIRTILENKPIILRSDGKFTRDFLYIEDAVDIQLMLAEKLVSNVNIRGEPFNFSLEIDLEIIDLVEEIKKIMNSSSKVLIDSNTQAEIKFMQVNSDKAKKILQWEPQFNIKTALERTVSWYNSYLSNKII